MRIISPSLPMGIEAGSDRVTTIVVENQRLFLRLIRELYEATQNNSSPIVFSIDNEIQKTTQWIELITSFVPFDLNEKRIIAKITSILESYAMDEKNYYETMELFGRVESYLISLSEDFPCNIDFKGIDTVSLIKACGPSVIDDSVSDAERVFQYINVIRDLFGEKLFVFVNMRSFFSDSDMELFFENIVTHNFFVLLIDGREYAKINHEERIVVDSDLCVI